MNSKTGTKQATAIKWRSYTFLYGVPTVLNFIACRLAIPFFERNSELPIEIIYFLSVGGIALLPMFLGSIYLAPREIHSNKWKKLLKRMRVRRISKVDLWWTIATFLVLVLASFLIAKVLMPLWDYNATPFFFQNMPLKGQHLWILLVWPIFFFFNIFGEELFWRGYLQPRQELLHGKWTWLVQGFLWAGWHLPMGFDLIFPSLPIFFILPAVVQLRKNTSIAIIVHAVFGAFGFLALALGAVH